MPLKKTLAKIISLLLIASGVYHTFLSLQAIFFIYPQIRPSLETPLTIQIGLIEKALVLYLSMIINGVYGLTLLLKPVAKIKTFHLILGAIIFIVSIFFVTKTSFTSYPLINFVFRIFE